MAFEVGFTKQARKQISKLSGPQRILIGRWIQERLIGAEDPRDLGTALVGDDLWRYRVGQYRIIARIDDHECLILVVKVGHRKDVYLKK